MSADSCLILCGSRAVSYLPFLRTVCGGGGRRAQAQSWEEDRKAFQPNTQNQRGNSPKREGLWNKLPQNLMT